MGTRNLTCVFIDGKYKIAQYGQWDGYPSGQGAIILNFIRNQKNINKLKTALNRIRFFDASGRDKEFIESYNDNAPKWSNEPDKRTAEQKKWFESFISRDIGGQILENVAQSNEPEILLDDSLTFAGDSLFCEWAYVVDFDKGTFEVYSWFNKEPLNEDERFYGLGKGSGKEYGPVQLVKTYQLDNLPTIEDFLKDPEVQEED